MGGKGAEVSGKEKSLRRHALKNIQITERKKAKKKLETTPQLSLTLSPHSSVSHFLGLSFFILTETVLQKMGNSPQSVRTALLSKEEEEEDEKIS